MFGESWKHDSPILFLKGVGEYIMSNMEDVLKEMYTSPNEDNQSGYEINEAKVLVRIMTWVVFTETHGFTELENAIQNNYVIRNTVFISEPINYIKDEHILIVKADREYSSDGTRVLLAIKVDEDPAKTFILSMISRATRSENPDTSYMMSIRNAGKTNKFLFIDLDHNLNPVRMVYDANKIKTELANIPDEVWKPLLGYYGDEIKYI